MPPELAFGLAVALLVVTNLVNNRWAVRAYLWTCLAATAALLALFAATGLGWAGLGLDPAAIRRGVHPGLSIVAIVAAGYALAAWLPPTRALFADRRTAHADRREVAYQVLVRIPLGTVLLEEVAFRGVLYGLVDSGQGALGQGALAATAVSSALFGLWHVLPTLTTVDLNEMAGRLFGTRRWWLVLLAVLGTALAGVVFCELRRRTGSLLPPMALHWAVNGLGYLTGVLLARRARDRGKSRPPHGSPPAG